MELDDRLKGMAAMVFAGLIWGLSPLYYRAVDHVAAIEVAAHRIIWSFLIFAAILIVQGRLAMMLSAFSGSWSQLRQTALAAAMISVNWVVWVLAVQLGFTTEASLGYFIFPLFAVFLGSVIFREQLTRLQWISVAIASAGVVILSIGLKAAPYIALVLAATFAMYGLIKKNSALEPVASVAAEALLLSPFALVWLIGAHTLGWSEMNLKVAGAFGLDIETTLLLIFSGAITAGPLILLSFGLKRLSYAEVGLLQYVNPSLQFCVAVFIFMEPFGLVHLVSFSMIWIALALYSIQLVRSAKYVRSESTANSGDSTVSNNSRAHGSAN